MKEIEVLAVTKDKRKACDSPLRMRGIFDIRPLVTLGIAAVLYVFMALICGKSPFGSYSFLLSDLKAQYAPFLALLRSKLLDLGNLKGASLANWMSYSFSLGLGKNFFGSFGYYLASPLNLLYLLFDVSRIDAFVLMLVIVKLSVSSSFMCLFLTTRTDSRKSYFPVLLGLIYGFSLYAAAYAFQIMWLDGYLLLPLLLYFIEKLISDNRVAGIIVTLFLLFITNYYIAYMVGIFSFLYLIVRLYENSSSRAQWKSRLVRFVTAAVLSAMSCAALIIPVGLDTITNAEQTIQTNESTFIYYNPLDLMGLMLLGNSGEFSDVMPHNLPYLFMNLLVTILIVLYLTSKVFAGKQRRVHIAALVGIWLSTALVWIDVAWQAFDMPNWFRHRQTFVFLPVFLIIALKVLDRIREVPRRDILRVMFIMFGMLFAVYTFGSFKNQDKIVIYNVILIACYCGLLIMFGVTGWHKQLADMPRMISPIMSVIVVFELVFAGPMLTAGLETFTNYSGIADEYSQSIDDIEDYGVKSAAQDSALGASRAEVDGISDYTPSYYLTEGEAMYGNFNGVSFFNSNSNKQMHHFLKQLGYSVNYNYFAAGHTYTAPPTDAFLSVGTVASRRDISFYDVSGSAPNDSGLRYYTNKDVLPAAFACPDESLDFDFYSLEKDCADKNYFTFQNEWYRSMFPQQFTEDFFTTLGTDVTGSMKITNGVTYDAGAYRTGASIMRSLSNESLSSDMTADSVSSGESSDLHSGGSDDPIGLESAVWNMLENNVTTVYRLNASIPICLEYTFKSPGSDELYLNLSTDRILNDTGVYVNGVQIRSFGSDTYYSQIIRLGSFAEGDEVKVSILADCDSWSYLHVNFAQLSSDTFDSQFAKIDRSTVTTNDFEDGYVSLGINNITDGQTVITTVPYEKGWTLYVDGVRTDYTDYQGAFIAFKCPAGDHVAELRFVAPGLKAGIAVSCFGLLGFIAFAIVDKKSKNLQDRNK